MGKSLLKIAGFVVTTIVTAVAVEAGFGGAVMLTNDVSATKDLVSHTVKPQPVKVKAGLFKKAYVDPVTCKTFSKREYKAIETKSKANKGGK